ncbi:uncharacterized protein LOC133829808 [Humulus lupulus]|uniref:uncharacterized protein LOC133829808 n=1 Tax=Humulus lupulus TaxID=3486 RepID=UPI002B402E85|nr:uncharacterized protein LOC133829808 [Humulus lupulus]
MAQVPHQVGPYGGWPMANYAPYPAQHMELIYERFRKQHAPNFEGTTEPFKAEEWLRNVEPILARMNLGNANRISCVSSLLKKDARIWWDLVQQTNDVATMIWRRFVELFHKKYYNSAVIATRVEEFAILKQGNLTVVEYARQFDRLAKFAPQLVPTDFMRVTKFVRGLRPKIELGVKLANLRNTTYADVLETTIEVERLQANVSKEKASKPEPKQQGQPQNGRNNHNNSRQHNNSNSNGQKRRRPNDK